MEVDATAANQTVNRFVTAGNGKRASASVVVVVWAPARPIAEELCGCSLRALTLYT